MSLKALTDDEKSELKEQFTVLDKEESGFINLSELKEALDLAGFKVCLYIYTVSKQYLNSIYRVSYHQLVLSCVFIASNGGPLQLPIPTTSAFFSAVSSFFFHILSRYNVYISILYYLIYRR